MVFTRKKGRPKGTRSTGYTDTTPEEKLKYHNEKLGTHRESKKKQQSTTPNRIATIAESTSSSSRGRK